jgi:hypothetical protein
MDFGLWFTEHLTKIPLSTGLESLETLYKTVLKTCRNNNNKKNLIEVPKHVTFAMFLFVEFRVDMRIRYSCCEFYGTRGSKDKYFGFC